MYINVKLSQSLRAVNKSKMYADGRLSLNHPGKKFCRSCDDYAPFKDFCIDYKGSPSGNTCTPCKKLAYAEKKARGEQAYYTIECSYCGNPIRKAPFCNEDCRHKFEQAVLDGVVK